MHGGTVTATAGSEGIATGFGSFEFYGGKVSASGTSYGLETRLVNLGYKNVDDSITISSFYPYPELTITVADGQVMTDGTNTYSGNITSDQIAGKTLIHGVDRHGLRLRDEARSHPQECGRRRGL